MTISRSDLRRVALYPGWIALTVLGAMGIIGFSMPSWLVMLPLLLSVVLLGLPHGALDHNVLIRLRKESSGLRSLVRAVAPYLSMAAGIVALWLVSPAFAFVVFILITWYHWGQGDLHSLLFLSDAEHLPTRWQRALAVALRGALPMVIPLIAFPEIYREAADLLVATVQPGASEGLNWLFGTATRNALTILVAALALGHFGASLTTSQDSKADWLEDLFEVFLLAVFFAFVHPFFAIGVYFCLWHSARHVARLATTDPQTAQLLAVRQRKKAIWRLVKAATPTTAAALLLTGGLFALFAVWPTSVANAIAVYLIAIAALTVPHVWVVSKMDKAEGIWERTSTKGQTHRTKARGWNQPTWTSQRPPAMSN